jgi:hypothetical protein
MHITSMLPCHRELYVVVDQTQIRVFDLENGAFLRVMHFAPHNTRIHSFALAPDGSFAILHESLQLALVNPEGRRLLGAPSFQAPGVLLRVGPTLFFVTHKEDGSLGFEEILTCGKRAHPFSRRNFTVWNQGLMQFASRPRNFSIADLFKKIGAAWKISPA